MVHGIVVRELEFLVGRRHEYETETFSSASAGKWTEGY